jgi:predicted MFS family arabinose efflux permease
LVIVALGTGALLLVAFVFVEARRGDKAMMPLAMFGSSTFVGLTLLTFLLYGALGGLIVLLPYVLIEAGGYSAAQAGAALLPIAIIIGLGSPVAGALAAKTGPRWSLVVGPLVVAGGFLLATRIGTVTSYWLGVFPAATVIALGMAAAVAPLTTAVLTCVGPHHAGVASGTNSAVSRIGGLVATAMLGGVMGASGPALAAGAGVAAIVGAVLCGGASLCAFLLIPGGGAADAPKPQPD